MSKEQELLDRIAALEAKAASQEAELQKLKYPEPPAPQRPSAPFADTIRFGMPASAVAAMTSAVDDKLMRAIVGDHLGKPISLPGPGPGPEPIKSDRGWVNPAPLKSGPQC
jgi:hypothetical protein